METKEKGNKKLCACECQTIAQPKLSQDDFENDCHLIIQCPKCKCVEFTSLTPHVNSMPEILCTIENTCENCGHEFFSVIRYKFQLEPIINCEKLPVPDKFVRKYIKENDKELKGFLKSKN